MTALASPDIAVIILAAGQGRRMGGPNKLLAELDGRSLVRRAADVALGSRASSVTVVTGHRRHDIERALAGLDVRLVHNPDHALGMSTSLRAGVSQLTENVAGVIVMLADMPFIGTSTLDRLVAAFDPARGRLIVVPTHEGRRGNPVLWGRRFFGALQAVTGDTGARHLLAIHGDAVVTIELGIDVSVDLDTPEAARAAGALLPIKD